MRRTAGLPYGVDLTLDLNRLTLTPVRTVLDVGAHRGESALAFARSFPSATIYSFEPVQESFAALEKSCSSFDNIRCFQLALAAEAGTGTIHLRSGSPRHSLKRRTGSSVVGQQDVEIETVDRIVKQLEINAVDLLKVDVEGVELEVLEGAKAVLSAKLVRSIFLEATLNTGVFTHTPLPLLREYLEAFDYHLVALYDQSVRRDTKRFLYANALFIQGGAGG